MPLDYERLDVYRVSLEFLAYANELIGDLPRGNAHLADQLTRSSTSIVLNIAEGAGKQTRAEKRRFYVIARGSAFESGAVLDVMNQLRLVAADRYLAGKGLVERIVSMLVKLADAFV